MLFRNQKLQLELMNIFMNLIDQEIPAYEARFIELMDTHDKTDADLIAASEMIARIDALAAKECSHDKTVMSRYVQVKANPSLSGYFFPLNNLTVGKVYLYMVWAMIDKKPDKNYVSAIDQRFMRAHMDAMIHAITVWSESHNV